MELAVSPARSTASLHSVEDEQEKCTGDCVAVEVLLDSSLPTDPGSQVPQDGAQAVKVEQISYQQLQPFQTRLIRILPDLQHRTLAIELVAVDLMITPGAKLPHSNDLVSYTAISYHWKRNDTETLIRCNDTWVRIGSNIVSVLRQHHDPHNVMYLWLDALCIDQNEHSPEKSFQVANMLEIFKKADRVTAWLGNADGDSRIAIRSLQHPSLQRQIMMRYAHDEQCSARSRILHNALIRFYSRSYLDRTWVRQEVYAARAITFFCGDDRLSIDEYLQGQELLEQVRSCLQHQADGPVDEDIGLRERLDDLTLVVSYKGPALGPRDLFPVLEQTKDYMCTLEQDNIYAIVAMCGIRAHTCADTWDRYGNSFLIDYSRSSNRVYHDFTMWLLLRMAQISVINNLWSFRLKHTPSPDETGYILPSWAVNWRDRCEARDRSAIERHILMDDPRLEKPIGGYMHRIRWPSRVPSISDDDDGILLLHGYAIDYVAYVSSYTYDLQNFLDLASRDRCFGRAGANIHRGAEPDPGSGLLDFVRDYYAEPFNADKHDRRLAIVGLTRQFALVPASTEKGDLVVYIAENTIPLVLSPLLNTYSHQLYATPDPYERHEIEPPEHEGGTDDEVLLRFTLHRADATMMIQEVLNKITLNYSGGFHLVGPIIAKAWQRGAWPNMQTFQVR